MAGKFILVAVDMNTPLGSSWSVNSPVTGNWEDFVIRELIPYIDANFRTLANRDSRGIAGEFMGGYGALRLGMTHPDVFGAVYALHPVGTGSGVLIMDSRPNWDTLAHAVSLDDARKDGFTQIFTTIFQAHLTNVDRPPLYIDLAARRDGDRLLIDAGLTERLRNNFFIESLVPQYAENLKSLRGFKFDWARSDTNHDHIYSNHALTHKLNEFGIVHEAEEYNGAWGGALTGAEGRTRVYTEVLPFFKRHLVPAGRQYGRGAPRPFPHSPRSAVLPAFLDPVQFGALVGIQQVAKLGAPRLDGGLDPSDPLVAAQLVIGPDGPDFGHRLRMDMAQLRPLGRIQVEPAGQAPHPMCRCIARRRRRPRHPEVSNERAVRRARRRGAGKTRRTSAAGG